MADRWIKPSMAATDIGFLAYWTATATEWIPPYSQQTLVDWNWSFVALDVIAAVTGLLALGLLRRGHPAAAGLRIVSLALTHAAGLNALAFWTVRSEFDIAWWLPNLWLTLFPVVALIVVLQRRDDERSTLSTVSDGARSADGETNDDPNRPQPPAAITAT